MCLVPQMHGFTRRLFLSMVFLVEHKRCTTPIPRMPGLHAFGVERAHLQHICLRFCGLTQLGISQCYCTEKGTHICLISVTLCAFRSRIQVGFDTCDLLPRLPAGLVGHLSFQPSSPKDPSFRPQAHGQSLKVQPTWKQERFPNKLGKQNI